MQRLMPALASAMALCLVLCMPTYADDEISDFIPVDSCDQWLLLTDGADYRLTRDLDCEGVTAFGAFKIAFLLYGNNITFDLGGHTITCLSDPFDGLDTAGVFLDSSSKGLTVRNGRIIGCEIGVHAVFNDLSTIRRLEVRDGVTGIYADSVNNAKIACNRSEGHSRGAIVLGGESTGNKIHQNIARNSLSGISAFGLTFFGEPFHSIPAGNRISNNTATGNALFDVVEAYFDVLDLVSDTMTDASVVADDTLCRNEWRNNAYITQRGPNVGGRTCIRYSKALDDNPDQGCAPGFDDDD